MHAKQANYHYVMEKWKPGQPNTNSKAYSLGFGALIFGKVAPK